MDPLVYYIKENLKKFSERQLRLTLSKEGYSSQEIDRAIQQAKKPTLEKESLGFFMAIMLALIFGVVAVIKPFIFLAIYYYNQQIIRYGAILFVALFSGWLCSSVMQKTTKKTGMRIIAGIMIAAIPTEIMMLVLGVWGFFASIMGFISQVGSGQISTSVSPMLNMLMVEITSIDVLVLTLMFFVAFNIIFLFSTIKEKKKGILALYILAPVVYIGLWYLVGWVINKYLVGLLHII